MIDNSNMIIWYNIKITDLRLNPNSSAPRHYLNTVNRFDIARYTFASMVPLMPFTSKIIFNLQLDPPYHSRQEELEEYIFSLFERDKVLIMWYRCNNMAQWRMVKDIIDQENYSTIFLAGNDDHVFIDSNTKLWQQGLDIIEKNSDYRSAFIYSHYPESMRLAYQKNAALVHDNNFLNFRFGTSVGNAVIKKELYQSVFVKETDDQREVFRMDGWKNEWYENIFVPTRELARHFDGYSHVNMDGNICPPLDIPPGFFEKNIIINYGYTEQDPNCVNINPLINNLKYNDPKGVDYKWVLDDLPEFWRPYIKEINISNDLDHDQAKLARNFYMYQLMTADHYGMKVDLPPEWVINHYI